MMQEMNSGPKSILDFLMEKRGFDFSGYHPAMLERRIGQRLAAAACADFGAYLSGLRKNTAEIDKLNEELEQRVAERTAELKKAVDHLEELNRVFVGRELKMDELKARMAELERQRR